MTEFVNQISYDFCSRYPFSWRLSLPVSLTTIANQNYLNPSAYLTNFADPWDAYELSTPRKLIYLPNWNIQLADPDYANSSPSVKGVPSHYNVDWTNQRLYLYPTPNSAINVKIRYLKWPGEVANSSASLFIPTQYHHVLASGVESLVWQMDEDLRSANAASQRYEAGIQRAIEQEQQLPDFQPIMTAPAQYIDYSDPFLEI